MGAITTSLPSLTRDEAILRIRRALQLRTGRAWSVTGGKGTAWGWIRITAPDRRRVDGEVTPADRLDLADALGMEYTDRFWSVGASTRWYWEFVDRAEGREPRTTGDQYWD